MRILVPLAIVAAVAAAGLGFQFGRAAAPAAGHHGSAQSAAVRTAADAAEIGFAQDMSVHHEQAVQMARLVQGRVEPQVGAIAAQIIEIQIRETGMMRGWLSLWNAPQLAADAPMAWMEHDHAAATSGGEICTSSDPAGASTFEKPPMPGMASVIELDELATLEGRQLEIRFLQMMVRHHRGGLHMADAAVKLANLPAVRDAAMLMGADQSQEIALMLQLLKVRGAVELPE